MRRTYSLLFTLVFLVTALGGCYGFYPQAAEPEPQPPPQVSYNGYLGLTVTVPSGWLTEYKNERNLTASPEESADLPSLDLYANDDASAYEIELIGMQNTSDSTESDHVQVEFYADYAPEIGEGDYLLSMEEMISGQSDPDYRYDLAGVDARQIADRLYTRFLVTVTPFGAVPSDVYYEEYYVTLVNGAYFVAYINYWHDNDALGDYHVMETLSSCFALDASLPGQVIPGGPGEAL